MHVHREVPAVKDALTKLAGLIASLPKPDPEAVNIAFVARRTELVEMLKVEAAIAFNRWLAAHRPDEPVVTDDDIAVEIPEAGPARWVTFVDRDGLEEFGAAEEDGSPVDSILRFIAWASLEAEQTRAQEDKGS